jgi:trimeric autotransporter adhesin
MKALTRVVASRAAVSFRLFLALSVAAVSVTAMSPGLEATTDVLPGGSTLSVSIDGVAGDSTLTVDGSASIEGPVTSLTYVLDRSESMEFPAFPCGAFGFPNCEDNPPPRCGDANNDGSFDTVLDCGIKGMLALHEEAIRHGVDDVSVLATGAEPPDEEDGTNLWQLVDVSRAPGNQFFTGAATDADGSNGPDVSEVLAQLSIVYDDEHDEGDGFEQALSALTAVEQNTPDADRRIVVWFSDGVHYYDFDFETGIDPEYADLDPDGAATLQDLAEAGFMLNTFTTGAYSRGCGPGAVLQDLADASGGTCTEAADGATLASSMPQLLETRLTSVSVTLDGGAPVLATTSSPLPAWGSIDWSTTFEDVPPGSHTICVTALGREPFVGTESAVEECVTTQGLAINDTNAGTRKNCVFTVTRTGGTTGEVSAAIAFAPSKTGVIKSGSVLPTEVNLADGQASTTITVPVRHAKKATVTATLSSPVGASISDDTGVCTVKKRG